MFLGKHGVPVFIYEIMTSNRLWGEEKSEHEHSVGNMVEYVLAIPLHNGKWVWVAKVLSSVVFCKIEGMETGSVFYKNLMKGTQHFLCWTCLVVIFTLLDACKRG